MKWPFGRQQEQTAEAMSSSPLPSDAKGAVSYLKQRLYEDPEFAEDFKGGIRRALQDSRQNGIEESQAHAMDYGDEEGEELSDEMHDARGSTVLGILRILSRVAKPEDWHEGEEIEDSAAYVTQGIRSAVGMLTSEAYFQGRIGPPAFFDNPAVISYNAPPVGQVVAWDRVRAKGIPTDQLDWASLEHSYRMDSQDSKQQQPKEGDE